MFAAARPKNETPVPHTAYQVDYVAINCGRIVKASKRRIRFKFGYTDKEALDSGKTGQDCRGSEHEVSITWSLSSGKQAIAFDQHEVYFDVGETTQSKISHSWKDPFGHTIAVKIHAASMSTKANPDPDWKQYDLMIDGVSFFRMPKIYQIGVFAKDDGNVGKLPLPPKFARVSGAGGAPDMTQPSRFGNNNSNDNMGLILPEDEPKPEPRHEVADLLSFDEFEGVPAAPAAAAPPAPAQTNYYAPPSQAPAQTNFYAPPAQAPVQPAYAPPAQASAPTGYAPPAFEQSTSANYIAPTDVNAGVQAVSSENQYTAMPNTTAPAQSNPFSGNFAPPATPAPATNPFGEAGNNAAPAPFASQPTPVTPTSDSTALVPVQPAATSYGVEGATKNLVNLDDLFGTTTAAPATKESVNAANAHKSLGQLQGSADSNAPKKPVMNTFNAAPAYNQQQQQPGMYNAYQAQQQPQQQPQYNNYTYQHFAQPGFGHQQ